MNNNANSFEEIVNQRRSVRKYDPNANFDEQAVIRSIKRMQLAPNSSNLQLWEFYRVKTEAVKNKVAEACFSQPAATTANELMVIVGRRDLWQKRCNANVAYIKLRAAEMEKTGKTVKALKDVDPTDYYTKMLPMLYGNAWAAPIKKFKTWLDGLKKPTYRQVTENDVRIVVHKSCALAAQTFMLSMTAEGYDTCPMEGYDSERVKQILNLPKGAEINMIIGMGKGLPEGTYGPRFRVPENEVVFTV